MIYTEIANIGHYRGLGKYLDKAVDYLSRHPWTIYRQDIMRLMVTWCI